MTHEDLRRWLIRNHYTQEALATELRVSPTTVKSWTLPPSSKAARPIPGPVVRVLELLDGRK